MGLAIFITEILLISLMIVTNEPTSIFFDIWYVWFPYSDQTTTIQDNKLLQTQNNTLYINMLSLVN